MVEINKPTTMATIIKLEDIPLRYIGLPGEKKLMKLEAARKYEKMKFTSLDIYNAADDASREQDTDEIPAALYVSRMNFEACQLMWYYHEQIVALGMEDMLPEFIVRLYPTFPFEFPESRYYHGDPIANDGLDVPFIDFYMELAECLKQDGSWLVYDIIERINN